MVCFFAAIFFLWEAKVNRRFRINYMIKTPQVRLIDEDGSQIGVKPISEALALAQAKGRDLVEISPTTNPPVCRIIDFAKFKYDIDRKERESRKKQKVSQLKEIRIRPRISEHDLLIKLDHARKFLEQKDKVQFSVLFFGREMAHQDLGRAIIEKIKTELSDIADVERFPSMFGNRLIMVVAHKK
jgi:translation initiation factor IF-3